MKIEYGRPNEAFIKNVKENKAVLEIFSNHANPSKVRNLLLQTIDTVIVAYKFQQEVLKIEPGYDKEIIQQEYYSALKIARMASQWPKFEKNKRLYPNLKLLPGGDVIPNTKLEMLYGVVLPVDDKFWDLYYPPNYLGCDCRVEATEEPITVLPDNIPLPDEGFRFNAGKPSTFTIK